MDPINEAIERAENELKEHVKKQLFSSDNVDECCAKEAVCVNMGEWAIYKNSHLKEAAKDSNVDKKYAEEKYPTMGGACPECLEDVCEETWPKLQNPYVVKEYKGPTKVKNPYANLGTSHPAEERSMRDLAGIGKKKCCGNTQQQSQAYDPLGADKWRQLYQLTVEAHAHEKKLLQDSHYDKIYKLEKQHEEQLEQIYAEFENKLQDGYQQAYTQIVELQEKYDQSVVHGQEAYTVIQELQKLVVELKAQNAANKAF